MASSSSKSLKVNVDIQTSKAERQLNALSKKINKINKAMNQTATASSRAHNTMVGHCKKTEKAVDSLTKKVGKLAKAYLGVMGARALITTSDTITKAQNKLNNLPGGSPAATQVAMDKMFASSQNARTGYADMMSNVSKSMTLAGDAFQGNIDNAIRFQEIMAKSYTVGGASAAEQSSSMYQLIQALGSGILQGDELRSVREGAPIAYKEIEKFAQGVYNTEESLKDLASQGKITSDIVVAAVMNAGDEIDRKFENTAMTFEQAFTMIKNTAVQAFRPTLNMLNDALNSDFGKGVINGIGKALQFVAGVLNIVFTLIGNIYNFIVTNWSVISKILLTLVAIIGGQLLYTLLLNLQTGWKLILMWLYQGAVAAWSALKASISWMALNPVLALIIVTLVAIIIALVWVSNSFVDACGIAVGAVFWVLGVIYNVIAAIINGTMALVASVVSAAFNIGIAFNNAWYSAKVAFWEWVSDCLNGTSMIAKAVSKIAKIFGLDGASIDAKIESAKGGIKEYTTGGDFLADELSYANLSDMYAKGYGYGAKGGQWLTDKVGGLGDWMSNKLNLGNFPTNGASGGVYDPAKAIKGIGDTADNTGRMADSMDLTQEDLEYLRKVADMEWKKEFTTATVQVDMSNYNTIGGDSDLDGIVTKLTDKLYEELDAVANGVYA